MHSAALSSSTLRRDSRFRTFETPVSIAEAIANATSNAATLHSHHRQKFQASSHTTYRDIAATFTYDQNPSNGGVGNEDAAMRGEAGVGSNE